MFIHSKNVSAKMAIQKVRTDEHKQAMLETTIK